MEEALLNCYEQTAFNRNPAIPMEQLWPFSMAHESL